MWRGGEGQGRGRGGEGRGKGEEGEGKGKGCLNYCHSLSSSRPYPLHPHPTLSLPLIPPHTLTPPHPTHLYSPSHCRPRCSISVIHKSITFGTKGCVSLKGHASRGTPKVAVSLVFPVISFLNFENSFLVSSGGERLRQAGHTMGMTDGRVTSDRW